MVRAIYDKTIFRDSDEGVVQLDNSIGRRGLFQKDIQSIGVGREEVETTAWSDR